MAKNTLKKVLILIADVGSGHKSVAQSLKSAFEENYSGRFEVKIVDLFKHLDVAPFNTSEDSYSLVSQNTTIETMSNFLWRFFNTKVGYRLFDWYTHKRLFESTYEYISLEKPDLIISAHPIISMVLKHVKQKNKKTFTVTVISDLVTLMKGWADTKSDLVVSPTTDAVSTLISFGVDPKKIIYPLFAVNSSVIKTRSKTFILTKLNLSLKKPTVLLAGGGFGSTSLVNILKKLVVRKDLQFIVITGRLSSLKDHLEYEYKNSKRVKILGFVNNIGDYYNASDVVITKPGPSTIVELELLNKRAILTRKIGEQEKGNIEYALRNPNFRYVPENITKLENTLDELLNLPVLEPVADKKRQHNEASLIVEKIVKLLK